MKRGSNPTREVRKLAVEAVLFNGENAYEVADHFNVTFSTVYKWIRKYKKRGDFADLQHRPGAGPPKKINAFEHLELIYAALRPASEYGFETDLWTAQRLQAVAEKRLGKKISDDTIWRLLRASGFTYQKPEKRYMQADDNKKQEWLRTDWPKILQTVRKFRGILFFEDECSISLSAVLGKTWAPIGETPVIKATGKRGSIAAISAISNSGRLFFRLLEKTIKSQEIIEFLQQMLKQYPKRHLIIVMDQARPHVSKKTKEFIAGQKRLHVFYLPPYSPEFNPDEKVWNHLKHTELKAHRAQNKSELKNLSRKKLKKMAADINIVKAIYARSNMSKIIR